MSNTDVIVIGGGASGLVAAIFAARRGNCVTILEKNSACGKKILVTGNGRCNYFNEDQNLSHFRSNNNELIKDIITQNNLNEVLTFFKNLGIEPKIKNGYYYPYSNQAVSIQNALLIEIRNLKIDVKTDTNVYEVKKYNDNSYLVITNQGNFYSNNIILATGTKASQKNDFENIGIKIVEKFGIKTIKQLPALVQLKGNEKYFKDWNGIRQDVKVSLYENNNYIDSETGEIQLTDYGVSGICVMNLSGRIARGLDKGKQEVICINFFDGLNINSVEEAIEFINTRNSSMKNRDVCELLEGIVNYKLLNVLLKKSKIHINKKWNETSDYEKNILAQNLVNLKIDITSTNSFDKAQVCSGGVVLNEINTSTMEVKNLKGLYITGELLDVDGDCGGYNLTWAWITGMIAGKSI